MRGAPATAAPAAAARVLLRRPGQARRHKPREATEQARGKLCGERDAMTLRHEPLQARSRRMHARTLRALKHVHPCMQLGGGRFLSVCGHTTGSQEAAG